MKKLFYLLFTLPFFIVGELSAQSDCGISTAQIDLSANKVRARLQVGGDLWWDGSKGKYQVPYLGDVLPTPSSLFVGGIWMGGLDPGGNLKIAASTYGRSSGRTDYYPGPLDQFTGSTNPSTCQNWDRFFKVKKDEINEHRLILDRAQTGQINYTADMIPEAVRYWPAQGNPYFEDFYGFQLPQTGQGLADFWDEDGNGIYNPLEGDYPALFQRGCPLPVVPDEMIFWIFNDGGGLHQETGGDRAQIEFQVTAFAFAQDNAFDYATFYKYKLINRAIEDIVDSYFGIWSDPDLGCPTDDYMGSDPQRDLWFLYNEDGIDGESGCACPGGVTTYCESVPMLGVDVLRGPLDKDGNELGMSSFTIYNNASLGGVPNQTDPQSDIEYYNYLTGKNRDGTPQDNGGFAFPGQICPGFQDTCLSMACLDLPPGDRRVVQAVGPMLMKPGDVNELIFGVIWVPDVQYPCPDLNELWKADDVVQAVFDDCLQVVSSVNDANQPSPLDALSLSPNPYSKSAAGTLRIENLPHQSQIRIFDLSGRTVADLGQVENDMITWLPKVEMSEGIYFVEVRNEEYGKRVLKWILTK